MEWTLEKEEQLRKLHGTMTNTQIGVLMGVSKNTISGRCHKLGLKSKPQAPAESPTPRRRQVVIREEQPTDESKPMMELQHTNCRFPQADKLFCAKETHENSSYCPKHRKLTTTYKYKNVQR